MAMKMEVIVELLHWQCRHRLINVSADRQRTERARGSVGRDGWSGDGWTVLIDAISYRINGP